MAVIIYRVSIFNNCEEASEELKKVKTKYLNEIKFCLQEILINIMTLEWMAVGIHTKICLTIILYSHIVLRLYIGMSLSLLSELPL